MANAGLELRAAEETCALGRVRGSALQDFQEDGPSGQAVNSAEKFDDPPGPDRLDMCKAAK